MSHTEGSFRRKTQRIMGIQSVCARRSEDEQNETLFYAARDAAMFLSGKIGISSICPDLEDGPEEEQELEETITLSLSSTKAASSPG